MDSSVAFAGRERRRRKMFVTKNTEYHFQDDLCVAVRDRRSGTWLPSHLALMRRLAGAVRMREGGIALPLRDLPSIGDALFFDGERELVTSSVCAVERPEKHLVAGYPEPSAFVSSEP